MYNLGVVYDLLNIIENANLPDEAETDGDGDDGTAVDEASRRGQSPRGFRRTCPQVLDRSSLTLAFLPVTKISIVTITITIMIRKESKLRFK